jgi:SAM-dependent methyltransferase
MHTAGWEVCGVEPSAAASRIAPPSSPIQIHYTSLHEALFPLNYFDAITLSHVIEHVAEPAKLLALCRAFLRPGGIISLSTPNTLSMGHRLFQKYWYPLDLPRHLHLFSPDSMAVLLRDGSFQSICIRSISKSASATFLSSVALASKQTLFPQGLARIFGIPLAAAFHLVEAYRDRRGAGCGEEVFASAVKPLDSSL